MKLRSAITACSVGNFLEWYDFALFGFLASILGRVFFPPTEHFSGLINSFSVFAIGFIMRPLGSIFFGLIGDRSGRKLALIFSILFITGPTFIMGTLPTYLQIGIGASIILTALRILQGLPIGGEMGGIICYLTEIAPPGKKGFFGSWSFFGSQIGFVISSLEIYTLQKWMSDEAFFQWGWRLSFITGGLLGLFGWYLRRRLHETRPFEYAVNHHQILKSPLSAAFKNYKQQIFHTFCLSAVAAGGFYITFFFLAIFYTDILHIGMTQGLLINAGMMAISCLCMPLVGKLGDRYGIKRLMLLGSAGVIAVSYLMYYFACQQNLLLTLFFQFLLTLSITVNFSLLPAVISKLFPTEVRYTGLGIGYNLSHALLGGPAPLVSLCLMKITGSNTAPAFYLIALGLITFIPFLQKNSTLQAMD